MKKCFVWGFIVALLVSICPTMQVDAAKGNRLINGVQWADTSGKAIQAHGGGMIKVGSIYYWFGENRDDTGHFQGVSCYSSSDLVNWTYVRDVLTKSSAKELNYCWVERPKVIYNSSTKQFVMWMHWENGSHYGEAKCAVAYCNAVDGNYTYQGSFRPYEKQGITDHGGDGYMSRDCNLFVDTDGSAYFISSSNENMDLMLYKLTSDYRHIDKLVIKLFAGSQREAPCLFKRGNYYFLLTSGCTGWSPNQSKYAVSTKLSSGWSGLKNIGDGNSFYSQPACVMAVQGTSGTSFLYSGDRWGGAWSGKVNESMYVWLPLTFPTADTMTMTWANTVTMNASAGTMNGSINYFNFVNQKSGKYLDVASSATTDGGNVIQNAKSSSNSQQWQLLYDGAGYFRIKNINSNKLLEVTSSSKTNGGNIIQWTDNGGNNQKWRIVELENGYVTLRNKNSNLVMDVSDSSTKDGANVVQWTGNQGANQKWSIQ